MSEREHVWLRVGAAALIAALVFVPRSRGVTAQRRIGYVAAPQVQTTAAKLVTPPRSVKAVLASADLDRN